MDMLTDRCATMCLLVNLSLLYPSYTFLFQISMSLDIASHWLHLHRYAFPLRLSRLIHLLKTSSNNRKKRQNNSQ